jgi:hypothetical protein
MLVSAYYAAMLLCSMAQSLPMQESCQVYVAVQ